MNRIVLIEIVYLFFLVFLPKQFALSPWIGIIFFILAGLLAFGLRKSILNKNKNGVLTARDYKSALILNTLCIAFCLFPITNYILELAKIHATNYALIEQIITVVNRVIIAWWIMIDMVRLLTGLRVKNILIVFAIYIIFGFLADVGFDYMTTAVVLVYAFMTGFFQTRRGKQFKTDYGLDMGEKYSFVDVDFLLAIIFLSYILVKATGISNIFIEFSPEESKILHTIDSSLWDGGLMLIISAILMYVLLEKGVVYKIYDVLDRFLRDLMDDVRSIRDDEV